MNIWTNPPETQIPVRRSPLRVTVGTPTGGSSNSWRVWTQGLDTYIACRDAYKEVKVSLHASNVWRLAFTEKAVRSRPELVPDGADRTWSKWQPDLSDPGLFVVALQIPLLKQSLFVPPASRKWPHSVVFVEPPGDGDAMTVISIGVAPTADPIGASPGTEGGVLAVLPLGEARSIQVVAHYEHSEPFKKTLREALPAAIGAVGGLDAFPEDGVLFLHGLKDSGTPWVTALPVKKGPDPNELRVA